MKNDYAVFIISHKRPEVETLKALEKSGYQGEYFIVIDDTDPTIEEYKSRYGEHLLVFNKEEIWKNTDTIDNFKTMTCCTYPRNYCIKAAREKGYKYLINFDDDIKGFSIRFEKNNKLASKNISDINFVFEKYIEFLKTSNFNCLGFILSTKLIGGLKNSIAKNKFYHTPMNSFILKANSDYFSGTSFEDVVYSIRENNVGRITCAIMPVVLYPSPVLTSKGGMAETYAVQNEFTQYFRVKIVNPSAITIKVDSSGKVTTQTHEAFFVPKIMNERWKK